MPGCNGEKKLATYKMKKLPFFKESKWPFLASEGYVATSEATWDYNCIAFAADVETQWWWPDEDGNAFWPLTVPREETKQAFIDAYATLNYEVCNDGLLEEEYEKIVIYVSNGQPTHASKQLPDGRWKSKLGDWEDIQHNTPKAVEEHVYGKAEIYMKRPALSTNKSADEPIIEEVKPPENKKEN
jgi:hypothetical protein